MGAPQAIGWFLLDLLPDAITLIREGREAAKQKKLDRKARREMIMAGFRAKQKTMRAIPTEDAGETSPEADDAGR